eukprot:268658_1
MYITIISVAIATILPAIPSLVSKHTATILFPQQTHDPHHETNPNNCITVNRKQSSSDTQSHSIPFNHVPQLRRLFLSSTGTQFTDQGRIDVCRYPFAYDKETSAAKRSEFLPKILISTHIKNETSRRFSPQNTFRMMRFYHLNKDNISLVVNALNISTINVPSAAEEITSQRFGDPDFWA